MVLENIALGCGCYACHKNHYCIWCDDEEFYKLWSQDVKYACNENVWIVPGTMQED